MWRLGARRAGRLTPYRAIGDEEKRKTSGEKKAKKIRPEEMIDERSDEERDLESELEQDINNILFVLSSVFQSAHAANFK